MADVFILGPRSELEALSIEDAPKIPDTAYPLAQLIENQELFSTRSCLAVSLTTRWLMSNTTIPSMTKGHTSSHFRQK